MDFASFWLELFSLFHDIDVYQYPFVHEGAWKNNLAYNFVMFYAHNHLNIRVTLQPISIYRDLCGSSAVKSGVVIFSTVTKFQL